MKGKLKGKRHRWSAWLLLLFSNILDKIIKICINLVLRARINLHQAMNFGNSDMIINWQYVVIEKILRKKRKQYMYILMYLPEVLRYQTIMHNHTFAIQNMPAYFYDGQYS